MPTHLRDLPALVIAPQQRHIGWPPGLEQQQQSEHFQAVVPVSYRNTPLHCALSPVHVTSDFCSQQDMLDSSGPGRLHDHAHRAAHPRSTKSPMKMYERSGSCPPVSSSLSRSWNCPWMSPHTCQPSKHFKARQSADEHRGLSRTITMWLQLSVRTVTGAFTGCTFDSSTRISFTCNDIGKDVVRPVAPPNSRPMLPAT